MLWLLSVAVACVVGARIDCVNLTPLGGEWLDANTLDYHYACDLSACPSRIDAEVPFKQIVHTNETGYTWIRTVTSTSALTLDDGRYVVTLKCRAGSTTFVGADSPEDVSLDVPACYPTTCDGYNYGGNPEILIDLVRVDSTTVKATFVVLAYATSMLLETTGAAVTSQSIDVSLRNVTLSGLTTGERLNATVTATNVGSSDASASIIVGWLPGPFVASIQYVNASLTEVALVLPDPNGLALQALSVDCEGVGVAPISYEAPLNGESGTFVLAFVNFALGKEYDCVVTATNDQGDTAVPFAYPYLVAGPPGTVSLSIHPLGSTPTSADVAWVPFDTPALHNGAPITEFCVQYKLVLDPTWSSVCVAGTETQASVTGLTSDETYLFRLRAENTVKNMTTGAYIPGLSVGPETEHYVIGVPSEVNTTLTVNTASTGGTLNASLLAMDALSSPINVTFQGQGFDNWGPVNVWLAEPSGGRFPCVLGVVDATSVQCTVATGAGVDGLFEIQSGPFVGTPFSAPIVSYPAPIITAATLRLQGKTRSAATLTLAGSSAGDALVLDGFNLGSFPSLTTVTFGPDGDLTAFNTTIISVAHTSITFRTIVTDAPEGEIWWFQVSVAGQTTNTGSEDSYYLPPVPFINSVVGCTADASKPLKTTDCPTAGAVNITLVGGNLVYPLQVFVGGKVAMSFPVYDNSQQLTASLLLVTLPSGAGLDQTVFVTNGIYNSALNFLVDYELPQVLSIQGCQGEATDCDRTGTETISITGTGFGASGGTVFVGGKRCRVSDHNVTHPHTGMTCVLPPGKGAGQEVTVLQGRGELSNDNGVTVDYQLCGKGTIEDGILCTDCAEGKFAEFTDSKVCLPCEAGTFANETGQWSCSPCAPGTYATGGDNTTALCAPCGLGRFTQSPGQPLCEMCSSGKFSNVTGLEVCIDCPKGKTSSAGNASCADCPIGTHADTEGLPTCLPCEPGKFSKRVGAIECENVPKGTQALASGYDFQPCEVGYFSAYGFGICLPCGEGTYQNATGEDACLSCPAGFSQNETGQTSCNPCAAGKAQISLRSAQCTDCAVGTYSYAGAAECLGCPLNSRWELASAATGNCQPCAAGRFTETTGSLQCEVCAAGKFSTGNESCRLCSEGRFSQSGSGQCMDCENGFTSNDQRSDCIQTQIQLYATKTAFTVIAGFAGLVCLAMIIAIITILRDNAIVHHGSPTFMIIALAGLMLMSVSVPMWLLDQTPFLCHFKHWMLNLGFALVFGSLNLKAYRLERIFFNKKLQQLKLTNVYLLIRLGGYMGIFLVALTVWSAAAQFQVDPKLGQCIAPNSAEAWGSAVIWLLQFASLGLLAYFTHRLRGIDGKYNDSLFVGLNITLVVTCALLFGLISVAMAASLGTFYIIFAGFLSFVIYFTFLFLFGPKLYRIKSKDDLIEKLLMEQEAGVSMSEMGEGKRSTAAALENHKKNSAAVSPTEIGAMEDPKVVELVLLQQAKVEALEKLRAKVGAHGDKLNMDIIEMRKLTSELTFLDEGIALKRKIALRRK